MPKLASKKHQTAWSWLWHFVHGYAGCLDQLKRLIVFGKAPNDAGKLDYLISLTRAAVASHDHESAIGLAQWEFYDWLDSRDSRAGNAAGIGLSHPG